MYHEEMGCYRRRSLDMQNSRRFTRDVQLVFCLPSTAILFCVVAQGMVDVKSPRCIEVGCENLPLDGCRGEVSGQYFAEPTGYRSAAI